MASYNVLGSFWNDILYNKNVVAIMKPQIWCGISGKMKYTPDE